MRQRYDGLIVFAIVVTQTLSVPLLRVRAETGANLALSWPSALGNESHGTDHVARPLVHGLRPQSSSALPQIKVRLRFKIFFSGSDFMR